jgi:hypothetical protein
MQIGKEFRIIEVEPIPQHEEVRPQEPEPVKVPIKEPVRVPEKVPV